jgi:frataxin
MTRTNIAKLGRAAGRVLQVRTATAAHANGSWRLARASLPRAGAVRPTRAAFSTGSSLSKPLAPEALKTAQPANITDEQYHKLADQYLDELLVKFEEEQDAKGDIDVEYSVRRPPLAPSSGSSSCPFCRQLLTLLRRLVL